MWTNKIGNKMCKIRQQNI